MVSKLLPASAAASADKDSVLVALDSSVVTRLKQILKPFNKDNSRLNSVHQQQNLLKAILSKREAIWLLASITIPGAPDASTAGVYYENGYIDINAYVTHVTYISYPAKADVAISNGVAYKLTQATIDSLVECCQRDIDRYGGKLQCAKLFQDFVQAINAFVHHADVSILKSLNVHGGGKFPRRESEKVKLKLKHLMQPLISRLSPTTNGVIELPISPTSPMSNLPAAAHLFSPTPIEAYGYPMMTTGADSIYAYIVPYWPSSLIGANLASPDTLVMGHAYHPTSPFTAHEPYTSTTNSQILDTTNSQTFYL
ncbi:hypothetical protein NQ176_g5241 [Zarea fungicola]|uniref:Uncharacterized protein n=1 Tax=Zarea fungicola TaxID=93591 RepID=A0ACC1NAD1_9HYPO|nr:hypothetical protein NQ176_g5241 [Lecanicillium fungicola]